MAIEKTFYYDLERGYAVEDTGEPNQSKLPIYYQSYEGWTVNMGKDVSGTFTAQDVSDASAWDAAIFTDWDASFITGATTAGFSGAVTSITADGFASAPPSAGYFTLTNGASETESVFYTAVSEAAGVYTFTVDVTLTYTYLEDDTCQAESSPPSLRVLDADIDDSDASNGNVVVTLDTDNPVFLNDIATSGNTDGFMELKGYDGSGDRIHYLLFQMNLRRIGDPNLTTNPQPETNYFTKAQTTAITNSKVDVAGDTMTGNLLVNADAVIGDSAFAASGTHTLEVVGDAVYSGAVNVSQLAVVGATSDTDRLLLGFDTTSAYGFIDAASVGVAFRDLKLNQTGGDIYIGAKPLKIDSGGLLTVDSTVSYETLVVADDDVPNKKYVDEAIRIVKTSRYTTTQTIPVTDHVIFANTDGGAWTATLPAGVEGQTFKIINSGASANTLTVAPDGTEHLLGVNSNFALADGETLEITFNSTDGWY